MVSVPATAPGGGDGLGLGVIDGSVEADSEAVGDGATVGDAVTTAVPDGLADGVGVAPGPVQAASSITSTTSSPPVRMLFLMVLAKTSSFARRLGDEHLTLRHNGTRSAVAVTATAASHTLRPYAITS
jgi:hypothetical protein